MRSKPYSALLAMRRSFVLSYLFPPDNLDKSQSISKERAPVTHVQQLLVGVHGSDLLVALLSHQSIALLVFFSERLSQDIRHHDRTAADAQAGSEAGGISRRLGREEDVAAADAA